MRCSCQSDAAAPCRFAGGGSASFMPAGTAKRNRLLGSSVEKAASFASTCFSNSFFCWFRLSQIMRKAIGTVMNTHKASRQSKKASRMQVRVTVMPFAISGGIVLLSRDSMLLQSAIIFVVSSERSLVLKKFIGSFRRCSAIRSRVVFDSLYEAI